jgi:ABC-type glycerol-3-phosphate transport system substrate-binding protein
MEDDNQGERPMTARQRNRREFIAGTAAASAAVVAAPYVHTAHAAGKLTIALWDHWVPGANKASTAVIEEWGAREKVEVQIDYITSQGNKLLLTEQAEALAKTGHDIMTFRCWGPGDHSQILEPVDDIMADLIKQNGPVNATTEYLGKHGGRWAAVPSVRGSNVKGPCSRIDLLKQHAGIDVQAMYPAGEKPKADAWTLDAFLKAAEGCQKAGFPFGIGLGTTVDSVDTAGAIFDAFGASLVDAKGNLTIKTDAVRQALEYYIKLARFLPSDAPSYDDASNNKILVAG